MMNLRRRPSARAWLAPLVLLPLAGVSPARAVGEAPGGEPSDAPPPAPAVTCGPVTLGPGRPVRGGSFGAALAATRGGLVVGSPGAGAGGVEVFRRRGDRWASVGFLTPGPRAARGDRTGASVAAAGDWIAAGRPRARGAAGGPGAGAVDVHRGDVAAGQLPRRVATLSPPDLMDGAGFGGAVAFGDGPPGRSAGWLAISAPWAPATAPAGATVPLVGEVHVFERVGQRWLRRHVIISPDPAVAQGFGASLAFAGRWLLAGAPGDGRIAPGAGRVYLIDPVRGLVLADADLGGVPGPGSGGPRTGGAASGVAGARLGTAVAALGKSSFAVSAPGRGRVLEVAVGPGSVSLIDLSAGPAIQGYGAALAAGRGLLAIGAPLAGPGAAAPFVEIHVRGVAGPEGRRPWNVARRVTWASGLEGCPTVPADHDAAVEFGQALCLGREGLAVGAPGRLDVRGRHRVGAVRWLDPAPLLR